VLGRRHLGVQLARQHIAVVKRQEEPTTTNSRILSTSAASICGVPQVPLMRSATVEVASPQILTIRVTL